MPRKKSKKYLKPKKWAKFYRLQVKENGKWVTPRKLGYWGTGINNKFTKWTSAFKHQRHRLIAGIPCRIKKFY